MLTAKDAEAVHERVAGEVEQAIAFAEESPLPEVESLYEDVYSGVAQ